MKDWLKKIYDANLRDFGHLRGDQLMGLTIMAEAGGEPAEGKIGVGTVILERVDHRGWDGSTIVEVCLWPVQFSCYLPSDPQRGKLAAIATDWDRNMINPSLNDCYTIAVGMIRGDIARDPDLSAAHCCQYLNPRTADPGTKEAWLAGGMKLVKSIGHHEFFA